MINKYITNITSILIIIAAFILNSCSEKDGKIRPHHQDNVAMVISISSDGKYVISSHINQQLILWDLKKHDHKLISNDANIYSAYFVKDSHNFMWQDVYTNNVYIKNCSGKIIKTFNPGFASYSEAIISDLKNYFGIDKKWNLTMFSNGQRLYLLKNYGHIGGLAAAGKLINLSINNNKLLTAGTPLIYLWDTEKARSLLRLDKNRVKTFAILSPNGKYIVSGDENGLSFVWDSANGKLLLDNSTPYEEKLTPVPNDFRDYLNIKRFQITSLAFIDKTDYLRFTYYVPYAILFSVKNPWPIKYFRLGKGKIPDINVTTYLRDQAIASAPKAHILVMGQAVGNGIVVYKYKPKLKTLKQIWKDNF